MSRGLKGHKKTIYGTEMTERKLLLDDRKKMTRVCCGANILYRF